VVPNPISAEPDDEYGFSETVKEWPNTWYEKIKWYLIRSSWYWTYQI
jgi:hypothetical protein